MASKRSKGKRKGKVAAPDSEDTLKNLYEIYARLDRVDAMALENGPYELWAEEYDKTRLAIMALEAKTFEELAEEHSRKAEELARAIDALEDDLHGLQDDAKVIRAFASGVKVLTSLVALLA